MMPRYRPIPAVPRPESVSTFWKWFREREDELFHFERNQDRNVKALAGTLRKVHSALTFELSEVVDGRRELIVSADGNRRAFAAVEALVEGAPYLERWTVIKFRPRRGVPTVEIPGVLTVAPDSVLFTLERDGELAGVTLFIADLRKENFRTFAQVGFLMLDAILGEYDVETKVGCVNFEPLDAPSAHEKRPITELNGVFDEFFGARPRR